MARVYSLAAMGATAPDSVKRLVDRFDQNRKACPERSRRVFLSPDYKEEQLRLEFLNPFFESLGWDVSNKAGLTEVFKPVIHEESIRVFHVRFYGGAAARSRRVFDFDNE